MFLMRANRYLSLLVYRNEKQEKGERFKKQKPAQVALSRLLFETNTSFYA